MANKTLHNLVLTAIGTTLSLALIENYPAQAATITYDFTLQLTSAEGALEPAIGNSYTGFFSYDDSKIIFSDPEFGGLGYNSFPTDFSLNFNNINYGVNDLVAYGRGRGGTVLGFVPTGNSFSLTNFALAAKNPGSNNFIFNLTIFSSGRFEYFSNEGVGFGSTQFSLRKTAVPEPSAVLGLSVLGFSCFLCKKKGFFKKV